MTTADLLEAPRASDTSVQLPVMGLIHQFERFQSPG